MDKPAFKKYMTEIKKFNAESDAFNEHIRAISQGGFSELGYHFIDAYCSLLSEAVGDDSDWVSWYCFDNDFGAKKFKAGYDGNEKPIRNLDDLWKLIQEGKANSENKG